MLPRQDRPVAGPEVRITESPPWCFDRVVDGGDGSCDDSLVACNHARVRYATKLFAGNLDALSECSLRTATACIDTSSVLTGGYVRVCATSLDACDRWIEALRSSADAKILTERCYILRAKS